MRIFYKERVVELVISILAFGLCSNLFTLAADDYGAFSYFNLPAGQFSNYPQIDYYYNGLLGLSQLYKFLYSHFPRLNWVGISFIGFAFLAMYLLLRTIKKVVYLLLEHTGIVTAVQLLFALFFVENIISISHTRFSLLFCGLGLFNLVFTNTITGKGKVVNTALFILGILVRPESGPGMILLVSAGFLIYSFRIKHLLMRMLFPVLVTASLFTAFAIDWANTGMYVKKVEPEIEYKVMDKRVVPLSTMKTAEDTVKYLAVMQGMWFDIKTLTPEYMRSLLLPGINYSAPHAAGIFFHTLSFYGYFVFIPCYIFSLLAVCLFTPGSRKFFFKIILLQLATFVVIYAADFNGSLVGNRHFLNLQFINLLITSFCFFNALPVFSFKQRYKFLYTACILFVLCGTSVTIKNYASYNRQIVAQTACYESVMQQIENTYSGRLIVSTLSNVHLLNHNVSILKKKYSRNKYIIFDVFTYSLAPDYLHYLGKECGCDPADPVAVFRWLAKNNAIYIAEPARYDLTETYMQTIHHQKIKFIPVKGIENPACLPSTDMRDYQLRTVVEEN